MAQKRGGTVWTNRWCMLAAGASAATILALNDAAPALANSVVSRRESATAVGSPAAKALAASADARYLLSIKVVKVPPDGATDPAADHPTSASLAKYAIPLVEKAALAAQGAGVDAVSGATYTQDAFYLSLEGAIAKLDSAKPQTVLGPVEPVVPGYTKPPGLPPYTCDGCTRYGIVQVEVTGVAPITGVASDPVGRGYWTVSADGKVEAHGAARYYGEPSKVNVPVMAMAATANGKGYLLLNSIGSVFAYGDAKSFGSLRAKGIRVSNAVGIALTADGGGYWIATSTGKVYGLGDAATSTYPPPPSNAEEVVTAVCRLSALPGSPQPVSFYSNGYSYPSVFSAPKSISAPIASVTATSAGKGYLLAGLDGSLYASGAGVHLHGSLVGRATVRDVAGVAATPGFKGYWIVARTGQAWPFGNA